MKAAGEMNQGRSYSHVTLVVDPAYGARAKEKAAAGPLWVIQSPANTPAIQELWATGDCPFTNAPTYFDAVAGRSAEQSAEMFIGTVDVHHPDWQAFEIIGTPLTESLLAALRSCAPGTATETQDGFVFRRAENKSSAPP